jgi:hypothetical protein
MSRRGFFACSFMNIRANCEPLGCQGFFCFSAKEKDYKTK